MTLLMGKIEFLEWLQSGILKHLACSDDFSNGPAKAEYARIGDLFNRKNADITVSYHGLISRT